MTTASNRLKGHFAAIFTILVWGSTFVSTKILLRQFGPVEILVLRFLLGWGFLWLIHPKKLPATNRKQELLFALAGLSGVTMNYLLENFALMHTQASNLAVIVSTAPLFVGILAFWVLKQKQTWHFLVGFFVSIAGIILISFPEQSAIQLHLLGDSLGITIAVVWAVYSILMDRIGNYGFDIILVTRRIFFYGLFFMIPFAIFYGGFDHPSLWIQPTNLALLLYLGIIACAVSYMTWNYAIETIGPVKANLYIYGSPIVTILSSVCVLHEKLYTKTVAGMFLTMTGVVLSSGFLQAKKFTNGSNRKGT